MIKHIGSGLDMFDLPKIDSEPVGDWKPYVLGDAERIWSEANGIVHLIYGPGLYGDRPLEISAGTAPNAYHIRLKVTSH
jgi:hypothetical protein